MKAFQGDTGSSPPSLVQAAGPGRQSGVMTAHAEDGLYTGAPSYGPLWGSGAALYDAVMVNSGHYAFVKIHRSIIPKVNLNVNCGLWVLM